LQKPADKYLFIGVAGAGAKPDRIGRSSSELTSYGLWSDGKVRVAGKAVPSQDDLQLPVASIKSVAVYSKRPAKDRVFSVGEEVKVTIDCIANTIRLESAMVDHTVKIKKRHRPLNWVLNINFGKGEHQVQYLHGQ